MPLVAALQKNITGRYCRFDAGGGLMKSDNIVFNKLETLFGYLQDVPMPANVTDTDGKLIFRNRLMEQAHRPWSEDNISGDAWVGGVKSDWSPDIPLGRRHDAPRTCRAARTT